MNFPYEHWSRLRTNNGLERIMKEIRRRTRVVGNFPDGYSAMMPVGARLRYISTTKWEDSAVHEHLQTLRKRYQIKEAGGSADATDRPKSSGGAGRLLRLRQLTFVICNRSETNVRKISDTTT